MIPPTHKQNQARRRRDTFLIFLWVFGYQILIRLFGGLQRIEQQFARPTPASTGKV